MVAIGWSGGTTDDAQSPSESPRPQQQQSRSDDRVGNLVYHSSVFVAGLLLLEKAADGFIRQVSQLSTQLGLSPTLIALLTAGAEWEELIVVAASIAQGAGSNLAIANVVGSAISNILGAFSLGILFAPAAVKFDDSSKRFAFIQAGITTLVLLLIAAVQIQHADNDAKLASKRLFENVVGVSLVVIFVLYFVGLSWAISRGMLAAPQGSDSESSSDSDSTDEQQSAMNSDAASTTTLGNESEGSSYIPPRRTPGAAGRRGQNRTATSAAIERTPLLLGSATSSNLASRLAQRRRRAIFRSIQKLLVTFLILSLAGYLLSHSILEIAALVHLSDTVLGLTVLSFATTIPEKFLSVMAGVRTSPPARPPAPARRPSLARRASVHDEAEDDVARGASSILMAGAAGSNIFLLTLCLGIALIFDGSSKDQSRFAASSVQWPELALLETASLSLVLIAFTDGQRWQGVVLLLAYIGFLVAEFTLLKR